MTRISSNPSNINPRTITFSCRLLLIYLRCICSITMISLEGKIELPMSLLLLVLVYLVNAHTPP